MLEANPSLSKGTRLRHQQIQLFRHLSHLLCHLCERIVWDELEANEKRRLRRIVAGLNSETNRVQATLNTSHRQSRQHRPSQTTKATFRKR